MKDSKSQAYYEGYAAGNKIIFSSGKQAIDNPYQQGTRQQKDWQTGFDRRIELNQKSIGIAG